MRKFLKPVKVSLLLTVVLAGALVLAGCDTGGNGTPTVRLDYDIVVVGAGAAGMPAALAASDALGAEGRVLLIEASGTVGGALGIAGGGSNLDIVNSNYPRGSITLQWGAEWPSGGAHPRNNPAAHPTTPNVPNWPKLSRVAAYADFVRWDVLNAAGRWDIASTGTRGGTTAMNFPNPAGTDAAAGGGPPAGPHGVNSMLARIEGRANITLLLDTKGHTLRTEGGNVIGVLASRTAGASRNYIITAERTILATGGFLANNQMMETRLAWDALLTGETADGAAGAPVVNPGLRELLRHGNDGWYRGVVPRFHDGHGIQMVYYAGGAFTDLWMPGLAENVGGFSLEFANALPGVHAAVFRGPGWFNQAIGLQIQNAILVNANGEAVGTMPANFVFAWNNTLGLAMMNDGNPPFHVVFTTADPQVNTTANMAALNYAANMGGVWANEVRRATNLAGIASAMGVNAETFNATIAAHNAVEGIAVQYNDEAEAFFAVRFYPGALLSFGGVLADWRGRVISRANPAERIGNLYAVGEMSYRDMFLRQYAGGSAIALSITQGFIAGTDAVRSIRNLPPLPSLVPGDTAEGFNEAFNPNVNLMWAP